MKEQVGETEAVADSATAAPPTVPLTQYGQVIALQRLASIIGSETDKNLKARKR